MLIAQERLAAPSLEWAASAQAGRPDANTTELAEEMRTSAAHFARTNGALAGTPFLIALVPAYVSVMWEQARMVMRVAALNGRDPREPRFAAEVLSLRGLYETPDAAAEALSRLDSEKRVVSTTGARARLEAWVRLVYRILIFAGFVSAPEAGADEAKPPRILRAFSFLFGLAIYLFTWVVPVTFMIAMSWGCENDTRTLGDRAMLYYGNAQTRETRGLRPGRLRISEPGTRRRTLLRILLLVISLGIPLGLITVAVAKPVEHAHLVSLAGFIGLAVVIALSARAAQQ